MIKRFAFFGTIIAYAVAYLAPRLQVAEIAPAALTVGVILTAWLAWVSWRHEESDD